MPRRYVTGRARAADEWMEPWPLVPNLTVDVPDAGPCDTGLVDHCGTPIMRIDEMDPIGFVRFPRA